MRRSLSFLGAVALWTLAGGCGAAREPLRIGYSDWPGWVAWEVAVQKGWFAEAGVDAEFVWFEYVPSMEAFSAGRVDAVCMTNGDAMLTGTGGKRSQAVVINDFSNGNDMCIARAGLESVADLKGRRIGVEVGFVDHLLLLKALEAHGLGEGDVELVNMPTNDTPQALASGGVDAVCAWYPVAGQALRQVPGSKAVFTSREVPGLIYDALFVDPASLAARRDDWLKVVETWFRVVDYIQDPATQADALAIMAGRVGTTPALYAEWWGGTHLLDLAGNLAAYREGAGLDSIYGSSELVNRFNVAQRVYDESQQVEAYLDPSLVEVVARRVDPELVADLARAAGATP
jgi:NitT/TauT family transport system substrate-binding protein